MRDSIMKLKRKQKKKRIEILHEEAQNLKLVLPFEILLANKFLSMIGFVDFIDRSVKWDEKHWKVSPGNLAKAVILVTFLKIRAPLSKIKEAFEGVDTEALFGEGVMPEHLNDYAIARALERINDAKPDGLFSSLCLSLYSKFDIVFKRLHSDTTTISFYGEYEEPEEFEDDTLKIVNGYNKDHRPESKQVVVGKIVNEHGIAVASSTMDGNTSDVEWNQKALELVKKTFGEKLNEMIYIADSKLINLPTFKKLMDPQNKIRFISRCPANFYGKVAGRLIEQAYKKNHWENIGKMGSGKRACNYEIQEFHERIENHNIRFVVVRSSAGRERYQQKLGKHRLELEKDISKLTKKNFVCEADAREEWERFKKTHKKSFFEYSVDFKKIEKEKKQRGNPGKNPKPSKIETSWQVSAEIKGEDKAVVEKFRNEEECFVLITSVEESELNGYDILRQYKDQIIVEVQFRLLKEPAVASTIFLKTPERINALIMLLNISLLIRALIQYKIRKSIKESKEEIPGIGLNNKKLENPTVKFVIESLQHSYLIREKEDTYSYGFYSDRHRLRVTTILKLLDISIEDFLE